MSDPPAGDPDFRLLDPSAFDWRQIGGGAGSVDEWSERDRQVWAHTMNEIARMMERVAERLPSLAGPFGAFAVTLRTGAVMGPSGPPTDPGRPLGIQERT